MGVVRCGALFGSVVRCFVLFDEGEVGCCYPSTLAVGLSEHCVDGLYDSMFSYVWHPSSCFGFSSNKSSGSQNTTFFFFAYQRRFLLLYIILRNREWSPCIALREGVGYLSASCVFVSILSSFSVCLFFSSALSPETQTG